MYRVRTVDERAFEGSLLGNANGKITLDDVVEASSGRSLGGRMTFHELDVLEALPLPEPCVSIDRIDSRFHEAVADLSARRSVAVGAAADLSLLAVAVPDRVYLFDLLLLGADAFHDGLRGPLESAAVQKIVHGCEGLSDRLMHRYNVAPVEVFDTQAADAQIRMSKFNHSHDGSKTVGRELRECISDYLGVKNFTCPKISSEALNRRPISMKIKRTMVDSVVHLHNLSETQQTEQLQLFRKSCDTSLRNSLRK